MKMPDGLVIGREYTIYRVCPKTGHIRVYMNRVVLLGVRGEIEDKRRILELKWVLKKDIKEDNGIEEFGFYVNELNDNYVMQETIR